MTIIMGKNTIKAVLEKNSGRFLTVYVDRAKKDDEIVRLLGKADIPYELVPASRLEALCGSASHQGFAAKVKDREFLELKTFLQNRGEKSLVVMLDSIVDPHNFGAILRSCECFGVAAVIFSKNRGAPLSPAVTKVSCGASELLPLIRVSNLAEALRQLQKEGFVAMLADINESAVALGSFVPPDLSVLIMGSEKCGAQALIKKMADRTVYIPMQGYIDSLNVAQAASVCLYALAGVS